MISQELELDIGEALANVDNISAALEQSAELFKVALTDALGVLNETQTVDNVDASPVEEAVTTALDSASATPVDVEVSADVSEVESALSALEGEDIEVDVEVDVSAAEAALDDLSSAAVEASGSTGDAAGSIGGLDAASGLAAGSLGGLASEARGLGGGIGGAAGAIAAIGTAAAVFTKEAIEARGASQRFDSALGEMADRVENLDDIQGLNTNLSELALTLGSDDDILRNVAARLFQLATASGVATEEAAVFTQQTVALGARAAALNPALGDIGEVSDALSTAFVRGGRFAAKFGLDLNQAEINARALADSGKSTAEELTYVDKAMAGAAIATEKYGKNLDEVIAGGATNAVVVQRRLQQTLRETVEALGMPLISPMFDLAREALPVVEEIGKALAALAKGGIPAVAAALDGVTPILRMFSNLLEALPDFLVGSATGGLLMYRAFGPLGAVIGALLPLLEALDSDVASAAVTLGTFAFIGSKLPGVGAKMGAVAGVATILGDAIGGAEGKAVGLAGQGAMLGAMAGPVGAVAGAAAGLALGFLSAGESAEDTTKRVGALAKAIDELGRKRAVVAFLESTDNAFNLLQGDIENTTIELRRLARESPDAARKVAEGLATSEYAASLTKAQIDELNLAVKRGTDDYVRHADAAAGSAARNNELTTSVNNTAAAIDAMSTSIITEVPTLGGVFDTFVTNLQSAFDGKATPTVQGFVNDLVATVGQVQQWNADVLNLEQQGLSGLAALVMSQGPGLGTALAEQIRNTTPEQARAWDATLAEGSKSLTRAGVVTKALAKTTATHVVNEFEGAKAGAGAAGTSVGTSFGRHIVTGVESQYGAIYRAGQEAARRAKAGADNAGSPSTHLFFDSGASFAEALVEGFRVDPSAFGTQVKAASDAMQVAGLGNFGGAKSPAGGYVVHVDTLKIEVNGIKDPKQAKLVGAAAARGALDTLDGASRRRIQNGAVTG